MRRDDIEGVQILRAIAAIGVTILHLSATRYMLIGLWPAQSVPGYIGGAGVDLFFAISGFVMVISSERLFGQPSAAGVFLARRIARVVPLYWLVTGLGIYIMQMPITLETLVKSLLFIPFPARDGGIHPLYGVGWTLNYEMFFYVVFTGAIWLPRERAVLVVATLLAAVVTIGHFTGSLPVPLRFWSDPIVLEFVLGMGLGVLYLRGVRIPAWAAGLTALLGLVVIASYHPPAHESWLRFLEWGVPALAILTGAVLVRRQLRGAPAPFLLLGDASYSIYLVHTLVFAAVIRLWGAGLNRWPPLVVLACAEAVIFASSIATFQLFERPVTRALRNIFRRRTAYTGPDAISPNPTTRECASILKEDLIPNPYRSVGGPD